ncbi:MAG TPA: hydroxymethylbilane synthase [Chitinophagaceae bacterium]|nr:hydroxymethylbilane synthase [Chitinophagaceae bacterium]
MHKLIRIGTRESQLAVWQATKVKELLEAEGFQSELVYIKSEGDIDLQTPLYEMGVQGIFTRALDVALLNKRIDLAVHSMKDVPIQLPVGIQQAAVLERGPVWDLLVYKESGVKRQESDDFVVATSSIRRKAQWLHKYPHHTIENLRGNVNTRLKKLQDENWDAAIFAQAGLERIGLRPKASMVLDWMLPAPAQGAIIVVCRNDDQQSFNACAALNHKETAICTKIERDFLKALLGGCSTPISALAEINDNEIFFRANIFSVDGKEKVEIEKTIAIEALNELGKQAAIEILENGGKAIAESIRYAER